MEFNETIEEFFCVNDPDLGPAVDRAVRLEGKTLASLLGVEGGGAVDESDSGADEPSGDDQDQVQEVVDVEVDEDSVDDFPTGSEFDPDQAD